MALHFASGHSLMIKKCKYCNKEFLVELEGNSYWNSSNRKIFCGKNCKTSWRQKFNPIGLEQHRKANRNYSKTHKKENHLRFKKRYIPSSRILLTNEEKLQRKRIWDRNYKYRLRKLNTKITLDLVQMIYEDNIKKYGTLTCYLCLKPIEFGQDSLEHKIPLSRGGTNEYNNLAIACRYCNIKKNRKTVKEFMETKNENT